MNIELSEQEQLRRESLAKLRELGIEPYPAAEYPVNTSAEEIKKVMTPRRVISQRSALPDVS